MTPKTRSQSAKNLELSQFSRSDEYVVSPGHHSDANLEVTIADCIDSNSISDISPDGVPPVYTIDLSLPPAQRYVQLAEDFKSTLHDLTALFDELLEEAKLPRRLFHWITHLTLRKLYSNEQTEEIRGISKVTGQPVYLLVALNVLLDLFMGCTSGGIMVKQPGVKAKNMLHFRTLDWGMPALRKALVQLEYRQNPEGPILARSITYAGFVGVLTGVRQCLSISLNFRPYHNDDSSLRSNFKFYSHLLLVLLGKRPSIATRLRDLLLSSANGRRAEKAKVNECPRLSDIAANFPRIPTTAAYLIFCDGSQTLVLEKDRVTAKALLSSSFIAMTNHDTSYEHSAEGSAAHAAYAKEAVGNIAMKDVVEESMDRKQCIAANWEERCKDFQRKHPSTKDPENGLVYVRLEELKEWLLEYPITNEETHIVAIMDPTKGTFAWVRSFEEGEVYVEDESSEQSIDGDGVA